MIRYALPAAAVAIFALVFQSLPAIDGNSYVRNGVAYQLQMPNQICINGQCEVAPAPITMPARPAIASTVPGVIVSEGEEYIVPQNSCSGSTMYSQPVQMVYSSSSGCSGSMMTYSQPMQMMYSSSSGCSGSAMMSSGAMLSRSEVPFMSRGPVRSFFSRVGQRFRSRWGG